MFDVITSGIYFVISGKRKVLFPLFLPFLWYIMSHPFMFPIPPLTFTISPPHISNFTLNVYDFTTSCFQFHPKRLRFHHLMFPIPPLTFAILPLHVSNSTSKVCDFTLHVFNSTTIVCDFTANVGTQRAFFST